MRRSFAGWIALAALCVAVDQWTKRWATLHLAFSEPMHVVGDLLQLTYTRNSGIAFGMFAGRNYPFYVFSLVAAGAVLWMFARHERLTTLRRLALAFILGGAVGNFIDRVRFGEVVDFILLSWHRWQFPVFNLADTFVTIGVALFALGGVHDHVPAEGQKDEADAHPGPDGPAGERGPATGPVAGAGEDRPVA